MRGRFATRLLRYIRRQAESLLWRVHPGFRARLKYGGEASWSRDELQQIQRWYNGETEFYGIRPPSAAQKRQVSQIPAANATVTAHAMVPHYPVLLSIDANRFAGKRVLEVGCGPLAPIMQFPDCDRHGLDPLVGEYMKLGWPLYDYGITFVVARGEEMPYVDGYFDAVVSLNALDHVDDFAQVAAEIQRVLKSGGQLFVEIEYHAPRRLEPQRIEDDVVLSSFDKCSMEKVSERDWKQRFDLLREKFDLNPDAVHDYQEPGVFVTWHGTRR